MGSQCWKTAFRETTSPGTSAARSMSEEFLQGEPRRIFRYKSKFANEKNIKQQKKMGQLESYKGLYL